MVTEKVTLEQCVKHRVHYSHDWTCLQCEIEEVEAKTIKAVGVELDKELIFWARKPVHPSQYVMLLERLINQLKQGRMPE